MAKPTRSPGNTRVEAVPPVTFNRTERALSFMVAGVFIAAFLCMVAMIVMWLTVPTAQASMPWPVVMAVPLIGFPIGLLLIITLLAITWTKRARANRGGSR